MGRWLKKIANTAKGEPTKLTQPSSVGFVSGYFEHSQKNQKKIVFDFVTQSCNGLPCEPQRFIDEFLSVKDEENIIAGDFKAEGLRAHMENWISKGMPRYSGKPDKIL